MMIKATRRRVERAADVDHDVRGVDASPIAGPLNRGVTIQEGADETKSEDIVRVERTRVGGDVHRRY